MDLFFYLTEGSIILEVFFLLYFVCHRNIFLHTICLLKTHEKNYQLSLYDSYMTF